MCQLFCKTLEANKQLLLNRSAVPVVSDKNHWDQKLIEIIKIVSGGSTVMISVFIAQAVGIYGLISGPPGTRINSMHFWNGRFLNCS